MGIVAINHDNLQRNLIGLRDASNTCNSQELCSADNESTITANGAAQLAFAKALEGHGRFSELLGLSADLIDVVCISFFEGDERAASVMRSS